VRCRSCGELDGAALAVHDPGALPPFLLHELFEPDVWQVSAARPAGEEGAGWVLMVANIHLGSHRESGRGSCVQDRVSVRDPERFGHVEITFLSPRFAEAPPRPPPSAPRARAAPAAAGDATQSDTHRRQISGCL
jgi:hypothetical protein